MNRMLFLCVFFSLILIISFTSCDSGSSGGGSSSGDITVEFTTPGIAAGESGYMDYTGILSVEGGNMTVYEITGVSIQGVEEITKESAGYTGARYKITGTASRDADGLFAGIAEATRELQTFNLDTALDPVPPFDPVSENYEKGKGDFEWDGNSLVSFTGYDWEDEVWVAGNKTIYEYYENGKLKSIRYGEWQDEAKEPYFYFSEAEWYSGYDDTFTDFPSMTWKLEADYGDDPGIPDDYDYVENDNSYLIEQNTQYSYTADSNGRIGTIIIENYDDVWEYDMKLEMTYDSSGNLSIVKFYDYNDGWSENPTLQMDFTIPSGLEFTLGNLFNKPWNEVLVPFFE